MIKDREKKKEALKKRVIKFDETAFVEQDNKKPIKNKKRKITMVMVVLSIVFLFLLFFIITRKYTHTMTLFTKTLSDTNSKEAKNDVEYISYKNGIIRYSLDGASYIDKNGSTKWSVAYNLSNPKVEVAGDYAFVADIAGVNGYLFTELGKIIDITSDSMIDKFSLSKNGDIAILTNENEESYVYLYDRTGKNGDVYIKYVQENDGVPLDIALSQDGKLLMVSLCKVDNNNMSSYVNIYNFDADAHMQNDDRLLKKIDTYYDEKIVAKVDFLGDEKAVSLYDGGLTFFDMKDGVVTSDNIVEENIIHSVYIENNNVYTVVENDDAKKNNYTLKKYDNYGHVKLKKSFNKEYMNFYVTNGCSIFTGINDLMIIDSFGLIRYNDKFFDNAIYVKKIFHLGYMDLAVGLDSSFKRVWIY